MDGNRFIGNYRITEEISSGAYGSVYKAEHTYISGRIVAIKFLHTYLGSSTEREQFVQEARFLALLEHRHVLPLYDFGFSERQPYLIASYAPGGSLRDLLRREGSLPLERVLTILEQVGQALHYAHQQQVIHRDLKPENILFNAQGEALLADFGIATMLTTASVEYLTVIGGTPPYMAPEQFQGIVSREGDQYALGCIAYELVTGRQPFSAPDFLSMGFKHLTETPTAPRTYQSALPAETEAAILRALAKQRGERHADVQAFLAALRAPFTQPTVPPVPIITSQLQATMPASPVPDIFLLPQQGRTSKQWLEEGDEQYQAGRFAEALRAYEEAIRLDPGDALAYRNKGVVLNELGRYEEAVRAYEEAIRLDPGNALAYNNKGVALYEIGRYKEALEVYEEAIKLDPGDAVMYRNKGDALDELGRHEEALRAYEEAIRLDPGDGVAHNNKGFALNELGRYKEALRAYEEAIRLDPGYVLAYNNKGFALNELGRYKEALSACEEAIRLDPNDAIAYKNKGNALMGLKQYWEALEAYEEAIRLDPEYALAYENKAAALKRLGREGEARYASNKARQLRNTR